MLVTKGFTGSRSRFPYRGAVVSWQSFLNGAHYNSWQFYFSKNLAFQNHPPNNSTQCGRESCSTQRYPNTGVTLAKAYTIAFDRQSTLKLRMDSDYFLYASRRCGRYRISRCELVSSLSRSIKPSVLNARHTNQAIKTIVQKKTLYQGTVSSIVCDTQQRRPPGVRNWKSLPVVAARSPIYTEQQFVPRSIDFFVWNSALPRQI